MATPSLLPLGDGEFANRVETLNPDIEQLRWAIQTGEISTGNHLDDGLIVLYGADLLDEEFRHTALTNYLLIDHLLSGNKSQPVLVQYTSPSYPEATDSVTSVTLAILEGANLRFNYERFRRDETCAVLPTYRTAMTYLDRTSLLNVSRHHRIPVAWMRPSKYGPDLATGLGTDLEIYVGTETIIQVAQIEGWLDQLDQLATGLQGRRQRPAMALQRFQDRLRAI